MRIRRRPQPSSLQQLASSDPTTTSTAPQTPQNAARSRGWLAEAVGGEDREAKLRDAGADLGHHKSGVARRLALPQEDNVVVVDGGRSGGMGARHGGADDGGHRRFRAVSNGHRGTERKDSVACVGGESEPVAAKAEEERVTSNGGALLQLALVPAVAVRQDEGKASSNGSGGGAKKRRGPAVLLEGSRCSRVNGRGWRCSQPTLVGYSLCEHHLGKGRMRSAAAAAAARGRLGRTEHAARIPATVGAGAGVVTVAVAAPPQAGAPSLPPC
ncbi:hypothetical protein BAE44_0001799 [Dichanthelium oligosanthes]|uniref:WRC domain-containing protein n=1 Tax=Dichanthelium oligosanthes TaxID=888268 RepID=A0A1E5WIF2_9POAL|nr:hypothetical protein BAE44_0001799 [Dichanthelium oligosanthes]